MKHYVVNTSDETCQISHIDLQIIYSDGLRAPVVVAAFAIFVLIVVEIVVVVVVGIVVVVVVAVVITLNYRAEQGDLQVHTSMCHIEMLKTPAFIHRITAQQSKEAVSKMTFKNHAQAWTQQDKWAERGIEEMRLRFRGFLTSLCSHYAIVEQGDLAFTATVEFEIISELLRKRPCPVIFYGKYFGPEPIL